MPTEADTCRQHVLPKLYAAGWDDGRILEQRTFTDGRIVVAGNRPRRRKQKRADYLLNYRPGFAIAVVEAKPEFQCPGDGLQQAKDYAQILSLPFAYSTNGLGIVEHDFLTGLETDLPGFPSPDNLWARLQSGHRLPPEITNHLFEPYNPVSGKAPRYYQEIAINRAVQAILQNQRRVLLTLATGTGKTVIAFQICWKLWNSRWNRTGEPRRPRILFLADRNVLVDDPKDKDFTPFGEARWKIEGEAIKSREMYFATYQAIARDASRPGLYREYPRDFFDLVIVDECHRGSARDESNWREILNWFDAAYQLGMTATPLRQDNRDTYLYFGNPLYTYSLRQGIEDGFLAPYRVHRIVPTVDATGWRPSQGDLDRYGREIPDGLYSTPDFERAVALKARTQAIARSITDFLRKTGRYGKTIAFCVDQDHAEEMRKALNNLNADLVAEHPGYVARVVSDEGSIGRGHLDNFMDVESQTPVIVTTSQMLTTGVDVPTCANIVLTRVINSMSEFKQIIGRGTRVRDDYGKLFFNILDYTGSATRLFADPAFDGEPALVTEQEIDEYGRQISEIVTEPGDSDADPPAGGEDHDGGIPFPDPPPGGALPRKLYYDGGHVEIAAHLVYELDPDGRQLRVVRFTDYTAEKVRQLYPSAAELRSRWTDARQRAAIIEALEDRGITFAQLAEAAGQPGADPFDLLCHIAFNAPLRTRHERARRLLQEKQDFFEQYSAEARVILNGILDKYVEYDIAQFQMPDILKVAPISDHGTVLEIAQIFGGAERLREAVASLQKHLYAA